MNQCIDRIIQIIRENKDKIRRHLESLDEISIVADNLEFSEMKEIGNRIIEGDVADSELLSFTDNGIRMVEITDDVLNELKELIPVNIERIVVPATLFKIVSKISDFPNLREFISNEYSDFKENTLEEELKSVIKLEIPIEGKIGELFKNDFVVCYTHAEQFDLDRVEVFDRRNETDSFLSSNVISMALKSEKEIYNLRIKNLAVEEVILFLEWLKKEEYEVDGVILEVKNETLPNIELLEKYAAEFNILIDYGEYIKTSYDDFLAMRAAIDWYKEIIKTNDLSPFETLIFAYDILKTFPYQEAEDLDDSRFVPNIIRTGNIVCVGYSKLLEMIINELGIKSVPISIPGSNGKNGHQRVMVRLDDDKYDIHGLFAVDATWDRNANQLSLVENEFGTQSVRKRDRMEEDKVIKEFDSLSLYNFFLIPYKEYHKVFWDEKLPDIFKIFETSIGYDYDYFDGCNVEFRQLFDTIDKTYIKNYIYHSEKPNLDKFREALSVVRRAEGYIDEEISEIVDDTIEINKMLDDCGVFFKEEGINK